MSSRTAEETVYLGRDDVNKINLDTEDPITGVVTPMDFTNVTRMVLTIVAAASDGSDVTVDSAALPAGVSLTFSGQTVTMKLGMVSATPGTYDARLVAYDSVNDDGLQLIHETGGHAGRLRITIA